MSLPTDWFMDLEGLPTLPGQILKALDEINNTSAMDYNILRLVQNDAAIALKVLKLANAPIYGYPSSISSIQQALGLLGPQVVRNIILTISILERFNDHAQGDCDTDYAKAWIHSAVTASLAGFLGRRHDELEQDVCFTAGLIHDAGKIVLSAHNPTAFNKILALAKRQKISTLQASREILGYPYPEIMAELAEIWQFPDPLVRVYKNLSVMDTAETEDKLTGVVCFAKCLAFQFGYPDGIEKVKPVMSDYLYKLLNISKKDMAAWDQPLRKLARETLHSFEE